MSGPDQALGDLLEEAAQRCVCAVERGDPAAVPDEQFGRLFASLVRVLAEKAQAGPPPPVSGGNAAITATDASIACTAILEAAGIEVFELSAWQALTDVGSRRRSPDPGGRRP